MLDSYNILSRKDEIEDLVIRNEIRDAALRLLDFVKDAAKLQSRVGRYQKDAIIVCADANEYTDRQRDGNLEWEKLRVFKVRVCQMLLGILEDVINFLKDFFKD